MSRATFNRVTDLVVEQAKKEGLPLEPFTVHDLRRTGSTLLNELGFNSDWIEKRLAHGGAIAVSHPVSSICPLEEMSAIDSEREGRKSGVRTAGYYGVEIESSLSGDRCAPT